MDERRNAHRSDFLDEIQVLNTETGTEFGKLGNVTTTGMMITSSIPYIETTDYQLKICLPGPINGVDHVQVQVTCQWCREDTRAGQYKSGFQFAGLTGSDEETLMILQTEYEMHVSLTNK